MHAMWIRPEMAPGWAALLLAAACGNSSEGSTPPPGAEDASAHVGDGGAFAATGGAAGHLGGFGGSGAAGSRASGGAGGSGFGGSGGSGPTEATGGSAGSAPTAPSGTVRSCFGTACPHGECDEGLIFAMTTCSASYSAPVDASSTYCASGATGSYCLIVGPDDFTTRTWLVGCTGGAATLKFCPRGCGGPAGAPPTCD
jgi:hypothetical protein